MGSDGGKAVQCMDHISLRKMVSVCAQVWSVPYGVELMGSGKQS